MLRELPPRGPDGLRATTPDMEADAGHAGRFVHLGGVVAALLFSIGAPGFPVWQLWLGTLGTLGCGALLWVVAFVGWWLGHRQQRRALDVFRDGETARGEVIAVERLAPIRIRGGHPWRIRYRFDVGGQTRHGSQHYWSKDAPRRMEVGAEVVVVHAASHPDRSLLWTDATLRKSGWAEITAGVRHDASPWAQEPRPLQQVQQPQQPELPASREVDPEEAGFAWVTIAPGDRAAELAPARR